VIEHSSEGHSVKLPISFTQRLRAYFLAGILITAPLSITVYITWVVIHFIDQQVARLLPVAYNPNTYLPFSIPGLGLVTVIVMLTLIGGLTAGMVGRMVMRVSDTILARMPVVRSLYSALKQVFETVLADRANSFRQVVLVQFPRLGLWRIGLVTGQAPPAFHDALPEDALTVYIPNTPNATNGFLVILPPSEMVPVDMTVEEALKMLVSAGIATAPSRLRPRPLAGAQEANGGVAVEKIKEDA